MRAADRQPSEHDHRNGVRHVSPESSGGRIGRHCADSQDAALHLRQQDLAQLAHVHRTTVAEAPTNAKLQHFMRDTLRVLSASMAVAGDRDRAIYWYRNTPIPEFKHRTAEQLVSTGKTDAVVSYLLSIESGSTG